LSYNFSIGICDVLLLNIFMHYALNAMQNFRDASISNTSANVTESSQWHCVLMNGLSCTLDEK